MLTGLGAFSAGLGRWARAGVNSAVSTDPRFAPAVTVRVGDRPVRLNMTGTAVRTKYRFRVYSIASYIQEGVNARTPDELAVIAVPKLLHMIFERDVDGETMAKSFRASIGMSYPAPAFASELASLERHFLANPTRRGDHIRLTYIPGVGLGIQVNAQPPMVIEGVAFAQAAWGTYFGPNHLGVALKSGLSSQLR